MAPSEPSDQEILDFITLAQRLLWAPARVREAIQKHGINLVPANFYSDIPTIEEVRASFENQPHRPIYTEVFRDEELLAFLRSIAPYAAEFSPPQEGSDTAPAGFFWNNSQFSYSDAMAYYAIVRHTKPRRIVEIGSGFSTLIASEAIARNGFGEVVCIEPYPRPFLANTPHVTLVERPIQAFMPDEFLKLTTTADILFIDSTHTVKIGSDCLYIYLVLLPKLQSRMLVHAHDVFLPFGMPAEWATDKHIYWTEQYLLYAYLLENPRARVVYASTYLAQAHRTDLDPFMHGRCQTGGSSLWFELGATARKA